MKENETLLDKANQNLNIANTLYETYRYDDEAYKLCWLSFTAVCRTFA